MLDRVADLSNSGKGAADGRRRLDGKPAVSADCGNQGFGREDGRFIERVVQERDFFHRFGGLLTIRGRVFNYTIE